MASQVSELCRLLRESVPNATVVYTEGGCFQLHLMILLLDPTAEAWYDGVVGHVYTKCGDVFYDIHGEVDLPPGSYLLKNEPNIYDDAFNWKYDGKPSL